MIVLKGSQVLVEQKVDWYLDELISEMERLTITITITITGKSVSILTL